MNPVRSVRTIKRVLQPGLPIALLLLNLWILTIWFLLDRKEWPVVRGFVTLTSIHADANVDYTTIHIWPNNWGWIDKKDIPGTIGQAIENTCSYIDMHVQEAFKINKPLVLEEFGLPRDSVKFTSNTSTVQRDRYYRAVFDIVEKHAAERVFSRM